MIFSSEKIDDYLFLAPLASYTDRAFRRLASEFGCRLCYTEMVSAEGLKRGGEGTTELLRRWKPDERLAVQLFGSLPSSFAEATACLRDYKPFLIDVNCGCPVPKVVKTGSGSALMRSPSLIGDIVRAIKSETDSPVTVKIRLGMDESHKNYLECAAAAVKAGADAVGMHARTRVQAYSGNAVWDDIRILKNADLGVPIIASGDIWNRETAERCMKETGCDGAFAARGAIGNPWIFDKSRVAEPSLQERISTYVRHLGYCVFYEGEEKACREMRKLAGPYLKGIPGSSQVKAELVRSRSVEDYLRALSVLAGEPIDLSLPIK